MLMQPTEWKQEQLDDDDDNIGPVLRAEQDAWPGWADILDQSRELKILLAQWDSLHRPRDQGPCIIYGNLRMARMNIYKLWCQDLVFLEYYLHSIHVRVSRGHLGVTRTEIFWQHLCTHWVLIAVFNVVFKGVGEELIFETTLGNIQNDCEIGLFCKILYFQKQKKFTWMAF